MSRSYYNVTSNDSRNFVVCKTTRVCINSSLIFAAVRTVSLATLENAGCHISVRNTFDNIFNDGTGGRKDVTICFKTKLNYIYNIMIVASVLSTLKKMHAASMHMTSPWVIICGFILYQTVSLTYLCRLILLQCQEVKKKVIFYFRTL